MVVGMGIAVGLGTTVAIGTAVAVGAMVVGIAVEVSPQLASSISAAKIERRVSEKRLVILVLNLW
jgi:hypothetical protein